MIEAVTQIIVEEGAAAVTHQRVAERSGVGRATVYRHWPTTEEILLSVFELFQIPAIETESGTLQQRLTTLLHWMVTQFSRPDVRAFIMAITERAQRDPEIRRVQQERMEGFQQRIIQVLKDAAIPIQQPTELITARLIGPIWFLVLVQGKTPGDDFLEQLVADFIAHAHQAIA